MRHVRYFLKGVGLFSAICVPFVSVMLLFYHYPVTFFVPLLGLFFYGLGREYFREESP